MIGFFAISDEDFSVIFRIDFVLERNIMVLSQPDG